MLLYEGVQNWGGYMSSKSPFRPMFWRAPVWPLNVFQCSILCVVCVYRDLGYNYKEWCDIRTALSSNYCWPEGILICDYQAVSFRTLWRTMKTLIYNSCIWKMCCDGVVGKPLRNRHQGFYVKRLFNLTYWVFLISSCLVDPLNASCILQFPCHPS